MGLNLFNLQIAHELDLNEDDVQQMTTQLRKGIIDKKPTTKLEGSVESDEIYIVAGHKGNPEAVRDKGSAIVWKDREDVALLQKKNLQFLD